MNSNENWVLRVRSNIYKQVSKFPGKDQGRIIETIEALPLSFYFGDIEKMAGEENKWRRRIGAYRIFYEILQKEKIIYVFWVERRTTKTY